MTKEAEQTNYGVIDVARFVMSILVIAIHVDTFYSIQGETSATLFRDITGLAVPFFFVTSGFFFREKSERHSKKYILKLLKTYICWTVVYIPLTVFYYWSHGLSAAAALLQFVQRFVLVGENFYSFQLWYLPALICSVVLYQLGARIFDRRKCSTNAILMIAILLFIGGRAITFLSSGQMEIPLISFVARLYFRIFVTTRNGMFYGFAFFMIGLWISDNSQLLGKWRIPALLVVGFLSACFNHFGLFFMMIPEIACLWIVLQKASMAISIPRSWKFRKLSEWNYYIHLWPLSIMSIVYTRKIGFVCAFVIALSFTCLLSTIIDYFIVKLKAGNKAIIAHK